MIWFLGITIISLALLALSIWMTFGAGSYSTSEVDTNREVRP